MSTQTLVATMHQSDYSLLEKMNIQSDAVVVNQCDQNSTHRLEFNGYNILWINTDERGVGRSRNRAILASSADILLFADDDVVYADGYVDTVTRQFTENSSISLAVFNVVSLNADRPEPIVKRPYRLRWHNCLKFGAFRIAVRREMILKHTVFFSLLFGGGAEYKAGEDNLFIMQCLQHGMVGIASTETIGTVAQMESTWFSGYDEKYYHDRGVLFATMFGRWSKAILTLFEVRRPDNKLVWRLKNGWRGIDKFFCEMI